jgi:hypothetical protein
LQSDLEEEFAAVLAATGAHLGALGFKKRRRSFRKKSGANIQLLEFQRSTTNEEGRLCFTLNVAVLSAAVAAKNGDDLDKLSASDGHLRERVGTLMGAGDKWWTIDETTTAEALADEVVATVRTIVLPYLDDHTTDDALRELWESGRSPGLTALQRERCLAALGG